MSRRGLVAAVALLLAACADDPRKTPVRPTQPLATQPTNWREVSGYHDTDRVPVQVVTMGDGHAFFVVGTDTASWPPMVWLFEPTTSKWVRQ